MKRRKEPFKKRPKEKTDHANKLKAIWCAAKATFSASFGVLLIFFFGTYSFALVTHFRVAACSNLYEDRELEILSSRHGPNSSSDDPKRIRGTILPDGIEVETNDNSVSLMSLEIEPAETILRDSVSPLRLQSQVLGYPLINRPGRDQLGVPSTIKPR